jgi:hypothetical protein
MVDLNVNYANLVIVFFVLIPILFIGLVIIRNTIERFIILLTVTIGTFFSGIGVVVSEYDNTRYLLPFIIFMVILIVTLIIVLKNRPTNNKNNFSNTLLHWRKLFILLGCLALAMHLSKLVYPEFRLFDLFSIPKYYFGNDIFRDRLAQRVDPIYTAINTMAIILMPFYFVMLYCLRGKRVLFLFFTILYPYIDFIKEGYLSRNIILLWLAIILFYLYEEKVLSKKVLAVFTICLITLMVPIMNFLYLYRIGDYTQNQGAMGEFLRQESLSQNYLYITEMFSGELSFLMMILRWMLNVIPFVPEIDFPVLAYTFSESILGLEYGDSNYYILLPGAFGEGIMMLGIWGAWIYGLFIALFFGITTNLIKNIPFLKYWLLFYVLNYALSFRGGFQTFFSQFFYSFVFLFIVLIFLRMLISKREK